jgi:hypothetical protein
MRESAVRELVQSGAGVELSIRGRASGFALSFQLGRSESFLTTARGQVRVFASLDTAAAFARELGLFQFEVDVSDHTPGRLRKARPDRAEALRRTRTQMQQQQLVLP